MDFTTEERGAFRIEEFARAHGLSRAYVYQLLREGRGPRVMKVGRRTLISREAARAWRERMEGEATRARHLPRSAVSIPLRTIKPPW